MYIGNYFSIVCLLTCLCWHLCLPLSLFGLNFWGSLHRNFISDFDVNFYKVLAQQTQRHTDTHLHHTLKICWTCIPVKQVKIGNFLLFGIAIVFQIVDLMFGWLVHQSKHIQGICLNGGICLDFYRRLVTFKHNASVWDVYKRFFFGYTAIGS